MLVFIVSSYNVNLDIGISFTCSQVFAKAMAETGQIKLYGDHPTLTETALARARKRIFKEERYSDQLTAKVYHIVIFRVKLVHFLFMTIYQGLCTQHISIHVVVTDDLSN